MKAKYVTLYGLRARVGSLAYKWLESHRKALAGFVVKTKKVRHPFNHAKRAIALAAHYIGTKEYPAGSNLQIFGRWYGENGVAWCAIFVSYCLSHGGRLFKYAYVPAIVADARANRNRLHAIPAGLVNRSIKMGNPVLACFDWTHDGTADHVGIVKEVVGGFVHTIEGNTGDSNWSNGGEVLAETRPLSLVQQFVEVLP